MLLAAVILGGIILKCDKIPCKETHVTVAHDELPIAYESSDTEGKFVEATIVQPYPTVVVGNYVGRS